MKMTMVLDRFDIAGEFCEGLGHQARLQPHV